MVYYFYMCKQEVLGMAALGAAFAEYIFKFIVFLAVAVVGVIAGAKLRSSKADKTPKK